MITEREMLQWVIANGSDEAKEKASDMIVKLDADLEKRRIKNAEKAAERQPLIDAAVALLSGEPITATKVGEMLGISTQKASSLLRIAVAQGSAKACEVKGNKGKVKGYTLA